MMRLLPLLLLVASSIQLQAQDKRAVFNLLASRWEGTSPNGAHAFEHWVLRGSMLDGRAGTLGAGGVEEETEQARIMELNGNILYLAFPKDQYPGIFVLNRDSSTATRWVFLNPDHGFPQRIVYEFEGTDRLRASISTIGGKEQVYTYQKPAKKKKKKR